MSIGLHISITVLLKTVTSDESCDEMIVPLAFLAKVRLSKILAPFALNLPLFIYYFFSCISFILSFILFILIFVFIKVFYCTEGFAFTSTDFEKKICGFTFGKHACKVKEYNPHSLYNQQNCIVFCCYCYGEWKTNIFYIYLMLLSQSQSIIQKMAAINVTSLNQTNIHSFCKKYMLTLTMVKALHLADPGGSFTEHFMITIQGQT